MLSPGVGIFGNTYPLTPRFEDLLEPEVLGCVRNPVTNVDEASAASVVCRQP